MGELALEIRELRFARRLCKELAEVNTEYIYQIRTLRGRIALEPAYKHIGVEYK